MDTCCIEHFPTADDICRIFGTIFFHWPCLFALQMTKALLFSNSLLTTNSKEKEGIQIANFWTLSFKWFQLCICYLQICRDWLRIVLICFDCLCVRWHRPGEICHLSQRFPSSRWQIHLICGVNRCLYNLDLKVPIYKEF